MTYYLHSTGKKGAIPLMPYSSNRLRNLINAPTNTFDLALKREITVKKNLYSLGNSSMHNDSVSPMMKRQHAEGDEKGLH